MGKKTVIFTKQQLHEILGTNMTYLDNADSDFKENGNNEVYSGEKLPSQNADPITTDKVAKMRVVDYGPWVPGGRGDARFGNVYQRGLYESNSDLEGTSIEMDPETAKKMTAAKGSAGANAVKNGRVTYTNATTIKSEMEKLKAAGDEPSTKKYQAMGGDIFLDKITKALNDKTALVQRDKENMRNMGMQNVFQEPGGTKNSGNGMAHTKKVDGGTMTFLQ